MSSLWTPGGERPVPPRQTDDDAVTQSDVSGSSPGAHIASEQLRAAASQLGVDLDSMSPEDIEQLQSELVEMMRVRREMAETPAGDMLANHLMRLFDLAVIYLEAEPPRFGDAATIIEAFRSVVEGLGDRLGAHQHLLQEALSQMQMVFVQVKNAAAGEPTS